MLISTAAVVAGFLLLMWTADRFVVGAAAVAKNIGVSPLVIGLTVVGFGTSAPEMFVSAVAAWQGAPGMGIGNAIGSNITNIALILGATALIAPLKVRSETLKREFPVLLIIMLVALGLMLDGKLDRLDGGILLAGVAMMLYWLVSLALRSRKSDPIMREYAAELPAPMSTARAMLWVGVGLAGLLLSSRLLVWGAVNIAVAFGVSDVIIGLTIIAIGTSLPELAASVVSALKREHDIAIGNVLGSNMFNLLVVLAMPGLISPGPFPPEILTRDFPVMISLTIALFAMAYGFRKPGSLTRPEGAALMAGFIVYQAYLYFTA